MARKRVSAYELGVLADEEIRKRFPAGIPLAIVNDANLGWRIAVGLRYRGRSRDRMLTEITSVEKRLREQYQLKDQ
jgi:hypothetical protein